MATIERLFGPVSGARPKRIFITGPGGWAVAVPRADDDNATFAKWRAFPNCTGPLAGGWTAVVPLYRREV